MRNWIQALSPKKRGHLLAFLTILVWGTTFISSSVVLDFLSPVELLFFRMVIAILALTAACPHRLKTVSWKHELYMACAGLSGVTLYFLFENVALTFTYSANCSVIVSTAPFFVAMATRLFLKDEPLTRSFFIGFAIAIAGVALVCFAGQALHLNPLGDGLCILAALAWAGYSVFVRKIEGHGYNTLMVTRRIFLYGLIFLLPCMLIFGFGPTLAELTQPKVLLNLLFLGLIASALCFVTWNTAVSDIGAVKTSAYIYLSPVVTIVASALLLNDPIHPLALVGAALTLVGLVVSQRDSRRAKQAA